MIPNLITAFKKRSMWYDTMDMHEVMKSSDVPHMGYAEVLSDAIVVRDLEIIKNVCIKDFDHFVDRRNMTPDDDPHMSKMLFFTVGEEWKQMRSKMSPTFTTGKIKRMFQLFQTSGNKLVEHISREIGDKG